MIIKKGQRVEVKGITTNKWKSFEAKEDFNTGDERWSLWDTEANYLFQPLGERCEIRIVHEDGSRQKIKYKNDNEVWKVIQEQIAKSKIKRYPWELIFGESLTKTILRHKMKGLTSLEAYSVILEHPMVQSIIKFFPQHKERLEKKIYISVCARYGENNTALNLYNKEFRK